MECHACLSCVALTDNTGKIVTVTAYNYCTARSHVFIQDKQQLVIDMTVYLKFQNIKESLVLHVLSVIGFLFHVVTGDEKF